VKIVLSFTVFDKNVKIAQKSRSSGLLGSRSAHAQFNLDRMGVQSDSPIGGADFF